ncbi:MAG TPA: ACP S-malonyltransferase [Ktedonobacterales bacterium]|nr:ACP S-malonyltransferase [Ktedonobacterales bacterium]
MTERIAFVFPGQGSQAVGMGADINAASPAARSVFAAADAALGFALSTLCFEGPEETQRATINAQPAIITVSLALLAALRERMGAAGPDLATAPVFAGEPRPAYVAGHSVGEYAAAVAAGALDLATALRLVRERGRLMHEEGTRWHGGMAANIGMNDAALAQVCAAATSETRAALDAAALAGNPGNGQVVVANYNSPGQTVISGEQRALERALELARAAGARRALPLAVSGAFHSPLMAPAGARLRAAIAGVTLHDPTIPLISNITAAPLTRADELPDEFSKQVTSAVQWTRTVEYLAGQGVTTFVEIGPGQVLSGLIKRIARGVETLAVGNAAEIEAVTARLAAPREA